MAQRNANGIVGWLKMPDPRRASIIATNMGLVRYATMTNIETKA